MIASSNNICRNYGFCGGNVGLPYNLWLIKVICSKLNITKIIQLMILKKEKKEKEKNTTGSVRSGCEFPKHYENVCFFYVMMYRRKPLQKVSRQSYFSAKIPKLQQFKS